jgi:hypothetical protein
MEFEYIRLGVACFVDGEGTLRPITGNYIQGVKVKVRDGRALVLGLVQENPSVPGDWRAVAATSDSFPAVNYEQGLWPMTPGRSGFRSRRAACLWLLGVHDARQAWFKAGE